MAKLTLLQINMLQQTKNVHVQSFDVEDLWRLETVLRDLICGWVSSGSIQQPPYPVVRLFHLLGLKGKTPRNVPSIILVGSNIPSEPFS